MKRGPHTYAVWWRIRWSGDELSAWHNPPKLYRSERAARRAVVDLTEQSADWVCKARLEYVALPLGENPHDSPLP